MAFGARAAQRFEASIAYGSTLESSIQLGVGFGVNATSTAMKATAIRVPRTTPKAPPSNRSSQERPVHLNNLESSVPINDPIITQPKKTTKKPSRSETALEWTC